MLNTTVKLHGDFSKPAVDHRAHARRPSKVAGHPFGACGESVGVGADLERVADVDA